MNSFKHLLLLTAVLFCISNAYSQLISPPSTGLEDIKLFNNNGVIDLKELNPAQIANEKKRRELSQEWNAAQNKWISQNQEQVRFSANCSMPLTRTQEEFDASTGRFVVEELDTFVYANNRLVTVNNFNIALNGARTATGSTQYFYTGTRNSPDSVFENLFGSTNRIRYTYSGTNQLTNISSAIGNAAPNRRAALTYDARGNLKNYKIEKQTGTPLTWQADDEYYYDYNTQNQLLIGKNLFYPSGGGVDSFKEIYTYDAQNRMTKCAFVEDVDTALVFSVKNHNAQKRPQLLEVSVNSSVVVNVVVTYQANDTILRQYILQEKDPASGVFVNSGRLIFEYCGDAVAVNELKKEDLVFQVFPNPATDVLNLKLNDLQNATVNLSVTNLAGQTVISEKNRAADAPLSIASLPSGLYVVKVQSADKMGVKTFSVMR